MKKLLLFPIIFALCATPIFASTDEQPTHEAIADLPTPNVLLSRYERLLITQNPAIDFAYIPEYIKRTLIALKTQLPKLNTRLDLSLFSHKNTHIAPHDAMKYYMQQLIEALNTAEFKIAGQENPTFDVIQQYMHDLESGAILIDRELLDEQKDSGTRGIDPFTLFNTNNGLAILSAGMINILGGTNISTSGSGSTVTISTSGSVTDSFPTDSGVAIPAAGALTVHGGTNITTSGSGSTVTISSSGAVSDSFPTDSGTAIPSAGALTIHGGNNITTSGSGSTVTVNVAGTTNNAVQVGNGTNSLTSLAVGTNGQVLIGASSASPAFATLTSTGGTITFTPGAHSLDLETSGSTANSFPTDSGTAVPSAGALTIHGGNNISTSGSGSTVTVNVAGTTNNAVQIGNATNSLTSLGIGTNGQLLIGSTANSPAFATLTSPTNSDGASSITFTTGANSLALASLTLLGNTLIVDAINGSGSATVANGLPFSTISLALTAAATIATSSRPVTIWVLPGYYNETLTMQSYVSVIGISQGAGAEGSPTAGVIVQQLNVNTAGTTSLVTMADNSRLENVSLNLTTSSNLSVSLNGILFPSTNTSSATARVKSVMLTINRTSTLAGGGENTYGIYCQSTGIPLVEVPAVRDSTISIICNPTVKTSSANGIFVNTTTTAQGITVQDCNISISGTVGKFQAPSSGIAIALGTCYVSDSTIVVNCSNPSGGTAYGLYMDTSGSTCIANDCYISALTTVAGNQAFGVWLNASGVVCTINNSYLSGIDTGTAANGTDVELLTTGITLNLNNTVLANSTISGSLAPVTYPSSQLCWTTTGSYGAGTSTLMIGGGNAGGTNSYVNAYYTAPRNLVLKNLRVQTNGPISGGATSFTVFTGATVGTATASALTVSFLSGQTASNIANCVTVPAGHVFYMVLTTASTTVANPVVTVEMY